MKSAFYEELPLSPEEEHCLRSEYFSYDRMLSSEIVWEITRYLLDAANAETFGPLKLNHFELVYDCLYYFLLEPGFVGVNELRTNYIKSSWAGCESSPAKGLAFLVSHGILEMESPNYSPLKAEARGYRLRPHWVALLDKCRNDATLYDKTNDCFGFCRHLWSILKNLPDNEAKKIACRLPRGVRETVRSPTMPKPSRQNRDLFYGAISAYKIASLPKQEPVTNALTASPYLKTLGLLSFERGCGHGSQGTCANRYVLDDYFRRQLDPSFPPNIWSLSGLNVDGEYVSQTRLSEYWNESGTLEEQDLIDKAMEEDAERFQCPILYFYEDQTPMPSWEAMEGFWGPAIRLKYEEDFPVLKYSRATCSFSKRLALPPDLSPFNNGKSHWDLFPRDKPEKRPIRNRRREKSAESTIHILRRNINQSSTHMTPIQYSQGRSGFYRSTVVSSQGRTAQAAV